MTKILNTSDLSCGVENKLFNEGWVRRAGVGIVDAWIIRV